MPPGDINQKTQNRMKKEKTALIAQARANFHSRLMKELLTRGENGVPSNADKSSSLSTKIANGIADLLQAETGVRLRVHRVRHGADDLAEQDAVDAVVGVEAKVVDAVVAPVL